MSRDIKYIGMDVHNLYRKGRKRRTEPQQPLREGE